MSAGILGRPQESAHVVATSWQRSFVRLGEIGRKAASGRGKAD